MTRALAGGRARLLVAAVAVAAMLAAVPGPAAAATPRRVSLPRVPAPAATVDHVPVDGVFSFDNGPRTSGAVALTFDADMTPGMLAQLRSGQVRSWYNQDVRDLLDAEHVRATLFLTGLWVQAYPEVARSLAADPLFEIGSHTHDHAAFRTPCYGLAAAADRSAEIALAQAEIEQATGVRPTLLRFPGDCYAGPDVALAASQGLQVISGDVRGGDGFNPNAAGIADTVLRGAQPGSIVILHLHGGPNAPMTAPALRMIIAGLRARGLGFATVSEVLRPAAAATRAAPRSSALAGLRPVALAAPLGGGRGSVLDRVRERVLRRPAGVIRRLLQHLLP